MTSAVPAAKAGLLAILTDAVAGLAEPFLTDGTDLQVTYAYPGELIERQAVFMGDAEGTETASIGQVSHRETFVIPVWIITATEGDDAQSVEERAWEIAGLIETAIRANPTLNAQDITGALVTGKTPNGYMGDGSRAFEIVIDVTCRSKILQP